NARKGAVGMLEDLSVGETKDGAADGAEPAIAGDVTRRARGVRSPIGLHHQSRLLTEEVEDKRPERMLSSELGAEKRSAAQQLPQSTLGVGGRSTQRSGPIGVRSKQGRHDDGSTQPSRRLRSPSPLSLRE